jgi:hypothetical protein
MSEAFRWPDGRGTAVTLVYDDCLPVHVREVAPMLSERGLTGSFYLPVRSDELETNVSGWRELAAAGHELGNRSSTPVAATPGRSYAIGCFRSIAVGGRLMAQGRAVRSR